MQGGCDGGFYSRFGRGLPSRCRWNFLVAHNWRRFFYRRRPLVPRAIPRWNSSFYYRPALHCGILPAIRDWQRCIDAFTFDGGPWYLQNGGIGERPHCYSNRRSDIGLVSTPSWKHEYQKLKRPVGAGLVSPDCDPWESPPWPA